MHKITTLALVATIAITGCATQAPTRTSSGNIEITLHNVDHDCVRNAMLDAAVTAGFTPQTVTDYQLVVGRTSQNAVMLMMYTSALGAPEDRLAITFVPKGPDLRLMVTGTLAQNPGTRHERVIKQPGTQAGQRQVEQSREKFETHCGI